MELRDFIEMGAHKAGSVAALGRLLDLTREATTQAKSHKRKLPTDAVMKLADYIGVELRVITAANELVTEKDEAKRNFYRPFVEHARAAAIAGTLTIACVLNLLTPTPAEAAPTLKVSTPTLCIMLNTCVPWERHRKAN
jgi:hypothetical protein